MRVQITGNSGQALGLVQTVIHAINQNKFQG